MYISDSDIHGWTTPPSPILPSAPIIQQYLPILRFGSGMPIFDMDFISLSTYAEEHRLLSEILTHLHCCCTWCCKKMAHSY